MKEVVVYGNSVLSQMLYYDSLKNPDFAVACFAVDEPYFTGDTFLGLPQIKIGQAAELYPPDAFDMLCVMGGYSGMRGRAVMFEKAKKTGYALRNYISPSAEVLPQTQMGENNIIFSQSYIGMGGVMGSNNIIRQQVYLGHNFKIGDHNFIGVGVHIGGDCAMGDLCYIAMGTTVIDHITVGTETLAGAGSVVIRNTEAYSKNVGSPARVIGYHKEEGIKMEPSHG